MTLINGPINDLPHANFKTFIFKECMTDQLVPGSNAPSNVFSFLVTYTQGT